MLEPRAKVQFQPPQDCLRYKAVDLEITEVTDMDVSVYCPVTGGFGLFRRSEIATLLKCNKFALLQDHAIAMSHGSHAGLNEYDALIGQLREFVAQGLLIADSDLLDRFIRTRTTHELQCQISWI